MRGPSVTRPASAPGGMPARGLAIQVLMRGGWHGGRVVARVERGDFFPLVGSLFLGFLGRRCRDKMDCFARVRMTKGVGGRGGTRMDSFWAAGLDLRAIMCRRALIWRVFRLGAEIA